MHSTKVSSEIKGSIEIVLLILIVVLSFASVGYYYIQKEPQIAKQTISLIISLPATLMNQPTELFKTVQLPTQLQETTMPSTEKVTPETKSVAPAVKKTNKRLLPSKQKTAEPLQKNLHKVAATEKTIYRSVYSIKVGSFKSKENADRMCKYLKKNRYGPSLETVTLNDSSTWYRVTAGQFKTQEEAARCAKNLVDKEKIITKIVEMK